MDRTVPEPEESKQDDVDDGATYSGASTSRLASTPAQKKASVSNSGSPENDVKANQSRRETDEQTENRAEAIGSSALRRAFQGIVRRREVKSELDRRTAPGTVASKKATQSDSVVYVEKNGKFRAMKKNVFEREKEVGVKKTRDDVFSSIISFISSKHPDVAVAYSLQRNFHNVSMIMQGFLSGLTVAEAVFAFSFANEELLLNAYRWLSLPVHVVFLICFTIGCVAAIDSHLDTLLSVIYSTTEMNMELPCSPNKSIQWKGPTPPRGQRGTLEPRTRSPWTHPPSAPTAVLPTSPPSPPLPLQRPD